MVNTQEAPALQLRYSCRCMFASRCKPISVQSHPPCVSFAGTSVDGAPAGGSLSGIEQIGTADEQSTLGLARGVQSGEAIAYPANILTSSYVPRTCTQVSAGTCSQMVSAVGPMHRPEA